MEFDDFKELIEEVTDGLKSAECEFGLFYTVTEKAEKTNTYWNEDIEKTLSKHFDVTVTNIHADDCEEYVGVWVVYR